MAELPFLKNKKNQGGGGPVLEVTRAPDQSNPDELLGSVCDEILDSYHSGDRHGFYEALRAFAHLISQEEED